MKLRIASLSALFLCRYRTRGPTRRTSAFPSPSSAPANRSVKRKAK